jgi:hypothetical protein
VALVWYSHFSTIVLLSVPLYHLDIMNATVCLIVILAVSGAAGQQPSAAAIGPPFGPANQLVSPDGTHGLFGNDRAAQLWLEDTRTHRRWLVLTATVQTLTVAWSPDSAAFIVNDRATSDLESAYLYDGKTLVRLDLRRRILAVDPQAVRFLPGVNTAPHSYLHAIRWLDSRQVEVQLHGHTDGIQNGETFLPGECFDLRYRVTRDGVVQKLSERVSAIDGRKGCEGME